ncbi:hypothetical protein QVD17_12247 [Tagetes erecta]|uniref:BED-type domain-containing protein n=1 Tax=Tagetes erecta TaxID=13708 RepID=A0AAD8L0W8_TARER|nr:hypothetical protein QVD17_12247 [Tagetes erecta]
MQGSTSNPKQGQQEYVNIDVDEDNKTRDENVNDSEDPTVEKENSENDDDKDDVGPKKRKKNSEVWDDFIEITLANGINKAECMHCKTQLTWGSISLLS